MRIPSGPLSVDGESGSLSANFRVSGLGWLGEADKRKSEEEVPRGGRRVKDTLLEKSSYRHLFNENL